MIFWLTARSGMQHAKSDTRLLLSSAELLHSRHPAIRTKCWRAILLDRSTSIRDTARPDTKSRLIATVRHEHRSQSAAASAPLGRTRRAVVRVRWLRAAGSCRESSSDPGCACREGSVGLAALLFPEANGPDRASAPGFLFSGVSVPRSDRSARNRARRAVRRRWQN
jgi:hypothetical protein